MNTFTNPDTSDLELCDVLCKRQVTNSMYPNCTCFVMSVGKVQLTHENKYIPSDDPVTNVIFSYLIKMDRAKLSGHQSHASLESAMFEALRTSGLPEHHDPQRYYSPQMEVMSGLSVRVSGYYQAQWLYNEKKKLETEKMEVERVKKEQITAALEVLKTLQQIGRKLYYVNWDGSVSEYIGKVITSRGGFNVMPTLEQLRIGTHRSDMERNMIDTSLYREYTIEELTKYWLSPIGISTFKHRYQIIMNGEKAFNSLTDAEDYWKRFEENEIMTIAKQRVEAEKQQKIFENEERAKLHALAIREAKIKEAMNLLQEESNASY